MEDRHNANLYMSERATRDEMERSKAMANATDGTFGLKASVLTTEDSDDATRYGLAGGLVSPGSTDNHQEHYLSSPLSLQDRKRKRLAEQHNKSEQRRRRKINSKLDELQSMVPFSRSREKAAILLDVIEYIRSVQAQLHIMSALTACDYATYHAASPRETFAPPMGFNVPPGGAMVLPTSLVPSAYPVSQGAVSSGGGGEAFFCRGLPGFGLPGSSGSPGGVEQGTGRDCRAGAGSGSGWSFSSGESSAPLGGVVDNTASSYEPLRF